MPRFANVVGREEDGGRAYEQAGREVYELDARNRQAAHENREAAYQNWEQRVQEAKMNRQFEDDRALAEAVPELYAIDPAGPDAHKQLAEVIKKHANLGTHLLPHVDHIESAIRGARELTQRADDMLRRQSEHEGFATTQQKERLKQQTELKTQAENFAERERKLKEEALKQRGPTAQVQTRYAQSSKDAADLKSRLDKTQGYIDEQEKKGESRDATAEGDYQRLLKSREKLQADYNKHAAVVEALELVHPQLNPSHKGDQTGATDTTGAKTPTAKPDAATNGAGGAADVDRVKATLGTAQPDAATGQPAPAAASPGADAKKDAAAMEADKKLDQAELQDGAQPHPFEGQRVRQKSTGQFGTFVNGQFVPES